MYHELGLPSINLISDILTGNGGEDDQLDPCSSGPRTPTDTTVFLRNVVAERKGGMWFMTMVAQISMTTILLS